ncbi:hypothetical protein SDC9_175465 [bioreactor metagenome]|uniref:Uncharacterized protein n=1 Tax=bioreactor metagenome TaxID=1076179 RepID=A0A645GM83_9ZZZZ
MVVTPYTTIVMLGGISEPRGPAAATEQALKTGGYPSSFIPLAMTDDIAEVVAGPDPETAPKNIQASVAIIAIEPRTEPAKDFARFTSA